MGSKSSELKGKVIENVEKGGKIKEIGDKLIGEAEVSHNALENIKGVDDDDIQIKENTRNQMQNIAKNLAESQIKAPGAEIIQSFTETTNEATTAAQQEHNDSIQASKMIGDYSAIGANLSAKFEQSAANFEQIGQNSEQAKTDLNAAVEAKSAELAGKFG